MTPEQRQHFAFAAIGSTITGMKWDTQEKYWIVELDEDGHDSEFSMVLMVDYHTAEVPTRLAWTNERG